jgi:RNA-binding motif X-linked protein 2
VRDKKTGKSRGFAFIAYEDQRSTVLAVDNFNGIDLCGRTIRVDHVKKFRPPKELLDIKEEGIDIFDHLYKPSGPDGKGWGPFRDKDVQEEAVI